jgi:hypothetical protein
MKETELAAAIVAWLAEQHWDVYQEVQFGNFTGVADIVAVRNKIMWIIETKTKYGFDVLQQASEWPVHYRSIGVPYSRNRDYRVAINYYRVGIIEVDEFGVNEFIQPALFVKHHDTVRRYLSRLTELHKTYAQAGSTSGHHLTPYKKTMMDVREFIGAHPGCTVREIYDDLGKLHYSSAASFKGNLVKALVDFESAWCRVDTQNRPFHLFLVERP